MDELSLLGVGIPVFILCLALLMGLKLSSKKSYH